MGDRPDHNRGVIEMADDKISKEEEEARNKSYAIGQVSILESLPGRFNKMAGEAYAKGRDEEALTFRMLAAEFKKEEKIARRNYEKYFKGD